MVDRGEFAFIRRLADRVGPAPAGEIGIGDDAAVLADGTVAAIDTLVQDHHFRLDWAEPEDVGWKALAVNLSDLAAMAAEPTAALAAVTLPPGPDGLADRLTTGLLAASEAHGCPLVGGDTTAGPVLVITVAVLGRVPAGGRPVGRDGARPGDGVYLTGAVGAAAAAVDALEAGREPAHDQALALHRPVPRLAEGRVAGGCGATAMIDISDGLAADLGHVLDASGVGARVDGEAIPRDDGATLDQALGGGDDYELCFTAADHDRVMTAFATAGLDAPVRVGTITDGDRVLRRGDREGPLPTTGWSHPVD
jgi:thiamine-monophosphate kinase